MSNAIRSKVFQATENAVASMGFELADVTFEMEKDVEGWVLTLFIYRPEGVSIDDCEQVSRAVEPIIDEIDPTPEPYFLSVSSLGLDRAFQTTRDFERYRDKEIVVKLYVPIAIDPEALPSKNAGKARKGKKSTSTKELLGLLRSVDEASVTIDCNGILTTIARVQIAKACPSIDW